MAGGNGRDPFPDEGPRDRDRYAEVGRRTRQSIERAIEAGASPGERDVLQAVIYWLTTWSKSSETISLGKIAAAAGMWDGEHDACPKWITKRVADRLRRLDDPIGSVRYRPGRGGRVSVVEFPEVEEGPFLTREKELGNTMEHRRSRGAATAPLENAPSDPQGEQVPRAQGEQAPRVKGSRYRASRGAATAPPPEEVPRDTEGTVRGTRARHDVGSLAAGTAGATTDTDEEDDDRASAAVWDIYGERVEDDLELGRLLVEISDHLDRHVPTYLVSELHRRIRHAAPTNVRLVLRIARDLMDEADIELPRLDLPSPVASNGRGATT